MSEQNILQQALGEQWQQLPAALRAHYCNGPNSDIGALDIDYPRWMQIFLSGLRVLGALVNRRGQRIPTRVEKVMQGKVQHWRRTIQFMDGKAILFKSYWVYAGGDRLIEYVNPVLGLCMTVSVRSGVLYYEGRYYVVRIGRWHLRLPEWLLLGHTTIVETALDDMRFAMDFRLRHPVFGQIFRYGGTFRTVQHVGLS